MERQEGVSVEWLHIYTYRILSTPSLNNTYFYLAPFFLFFTFFFTLPYLFYCFYNTVLYLFYYYCNFICI
jgi:hypothetical protein